MRSLCDCAGKVVNRICSRKFVALGRVLRHWEDIVGQALATKAQPIRLTYERTKNAKKPVATLHIATTAAQATILHYQTGVILERINHVFGDNWIVALHFVITQSEHDIPKKSPSSILVPSPLQEEAATKETRTITDEQMRLALVSLGRHIVV